LTLADAKKEVYDHDLYYLLSEHQEPSDAAHPLFELTSFQVVTNDICPTATVTLKINGQERKGSAIGDGPIDALYSAIKSLTGIDAKLTSYKINSISHGKEAIGRVNIQLEAGGKAYTGRAMDTDIIKASGQAFVNGINAMVLAGAIENDSNITNVM
jgi:2-isopropylmalate synthase